MPWQLLVSLVHMISTENQWSLHTEIMCERSTYYSLSIPFKNIVLANPYPWTSLQFHVYPSKPKDGILRCISFDLWCKNCISFDQSCKECISCEREMRNIWMEGQGARPEASAGCIQGAPQLKFNSVDHGEVQVQVQIQALVLEQVQLLGASTST